MKRFVAIVLAAALAVPAVAQTWQDALLFSENNYSGTARGVGMGNALTAVGGDPGAIIFNPAAGAVAGYSQFYLSPGLSFSSMTAEGTVLPGDIKAVGMGDRVNTNYARFKIPSGGFVVNMDTGRRTGLRRMSFGFVLQNTNDFTSRFNAKGVNESTSYAASLASSADGYLPSVLGAEDWFYSGNDPSRLPAWVDMTAYRSGMFNGITGRDGAYIALTEVMDSDGNMRLAAPVFQQYGQQTSGSKRDMVTSFSANYSDKFYIGLNLGISMLNYNLNEYWTESPQNPDEFPDIKYSDGRTERFSSLRMKRNYRMRGAGVYLKAGMLWRPIDGLRLGAAFQTPTVMDITERYAFSGEVNMEGRNTSVASSPEDEWGYRLVSPFRFNAGAAFTLGSIGLVSADYEYANYGGAHYSGRDGYVSDSFTWANEDIRDLLGASHQFRLGAEIKPLPTVALRAGYNFTTGAQENELVNGHPVALDSQFKSALARQAYSLGFGYSGSGSFYLDAAVRLRTAPVDYILVYNYYKATDPAKYWNKVVDEDVFSPEVKLTSWLADAIVTLGWRF